MMKRKHECALGNVEGAVYRGPGWKEDVSGQRTFCKPLEYTYTEEMIEVWKAE
jgi:hypothetical protein